MGNKDSDQIAINSPYSPVRRRPPYSRAVAIRFGGYLTPSSLPAHVGRVQPGGGIGADAAAAGVVVDWGRGEVVVPGAGAAARADRGGGRGRRGMNARLGAPAVSRTAASAKAASTSKWGCMTNRDQDRV